MTAYDHHDLPVCAEGSTLLTADAREVHIAEFDLTREADAVRATIGLTGQFSAVDNLLTGRREPAVDGGPPPPGPG